MELEQASISIGAAARLTGINANTLRMWERRYQLGPSKRSSGGQREYSTTDIDHLRLIKKLLDQGLRIGDIARLSSKTLAGLLLDAGVPTTEPQREAPALRSQIVGTALCDFFRTHLKRYPKLLAEFASVDADAWLQNESIQDKDLLVLQQNSINRQHVAPLIKISQQKVHVVVIYMYAQDSHIEKLQAEGIILLRGKIDSALIDDAINRVIRLVANLSVLDQNGKQFEIALPQSQPRQFSDQELLEAEQLAEKLDCSCPQHLGELIRLLNAFEEYSQSCGAENWKEAAVHACVYSYANNARFFMEKALRAVLDE
ncbi:MAG: MerR family transcriptional regulator [Cellvibrionaceae bacterium]|nr:MerR family transcriptional regulator [Cellvibrionaceae bacterium]